MNVRISACPGAYFVKVIMDGAPYLRNVDLNSYSTYQELSLSLEKMFSCFTFGKSDATESTGSETKLRSSLRGSDYVLTFEDKDGDRRTMAFRKVSKDDKIAFSQWKSHMESKNLVLCCSSLIDTEKEFVSQFEKLFEVRILNNWDPSITYYCFDKQGWSLQKDPQCFDGSFTFHRKKPLLGDRETNSSEHLLQPHT